MKLLIIGATGQTGKILVRQALVQGHEVTAFARNPADVTLHHANLTVVRGDVVDPPSIAATLVGQDCALCIRRSKP